MKMQGILEARTKPGTAGELEVFVDGRWQPHGTLSAESTTAAAVRGAITEGSRRPEGKSLEQQLQEQQAEIERLRGAEDRAARELTPEELAKLRWEA